MRNSILWLFWLVLPVFALTYHYGPGQVWLARDRAATLIRHAQAQNEAATAAQQTAYESQLELLDARRAAFVAGVDWQSQPQHPLAQSVLGATAKQDAAYEQAAELWDLTAEQFGQASETLLKAISQSKTGDAGLSASDRQLLESLRWAEARALVRSGEVFNGIEQLQALLDLRLAEAHQRAATNVQLTSTGGRVEPAQLPTDAIREELAAAQYVGARLLREEGRSPEVWRPVANESRQHYRYLSTPQNFPDRDSKTMPHTQQSSTQSGQAASEPLDRGQRMQRNLEQVLNLEQSVSDQLEGLPLPRSAPLARRPGDGEPGNKPGKNPGRGPLKDGPPAAGAGIPGPYGAGW